MQTRCTPTAFFDVGEKPWVLSTPDMKGRYFLLPFLSGWTDVFQVPGIRTTGTQAQTFLITGPHCPERSRLAYHNLSRPPPSYGSLGTPEDYAAVHSLQDRFKLQPLSTWGKDYTPPTGKVDPSIDMKTAVRDQVNRLSTAEYFTLLADLSPPVTKAG
jgi:hypothetical protein